MSLQNLAVCLPCILRISFFRGYRILALFHAIFRERQQDEPARPARPASPLPAPSSTNTMTIGNGNSNVGNTNNSHNNSYNNSKTTNVHGPVGALGEHARAEWNNARFNYGPPNTSDSHSNSTTHIQGPVGTLSGGGSRVG